MNAGTLNQIPTRLSLETEPWVITMLYLIIVSVSTDGENTLLLFEENLSIIFHLDSLVILIVHEHICKYVHTLEIGQSSESKEWQEWNLDFLNYGWICVFFSLFSSKSSEFIQLSIDFKI